METRLQSAQNGSKKPKKRRSQDEKIGRREWVIRALKRQEVVLGRIDCRTRMLAAGLRELFMLGEDYVSMVACEDEIDVALLNALREAGTTGLQSGELAAQLDINHRDVSRRIFRMNKRMEQEISENIIEKHGHKWELFSLALGVTFLRACIPKVILKV